MNPNFTEEEKQSINTIANKMSVEIGRQIEKLNHDVSSLLILDVLSKICSYYISFMLSQNNQSNDPVVLEEFMEEFKRATMHYTNKIIELGKMNLQ